MAPNKGLLIVSTLLCISLFVYFFVSSSQWLQGVSNGPRDFDVVVFSQNLPFAACAKLHAESPSKRCLLPADGGWKIRGLAPFFLNKAGPGSCKQSLTVNMTKLATIKNQLLMQWPDLYNQTTTWEQRDKFVKMPVNNFPTTTMAPTTETNTFPSTMMPDVNNETNNLPTMSMMDLANDLPATTTMTSLNESNDLIITTTTIKSENLQSKIVAESSRVAREISTPATILISDTESPSETEESLVVSTSQDPLSINVTEKNLTEQITTTTMMTTTTTTTTTARPSVISKIASKSITADDLTSGVVLTSGAIKTTPAPKMMRGNYFNYWENEWEKRGACGFDGDDQILGYFKKGFSLMEEYDMTGILKKAHILPGVDHSVMKIQERLEKVVGARCRVKCFWDEERQTSYLLEVSICFDKSVKNPVDCDTVGGSLTNCYADKNVEYLDRKKFNCIINNNCEKRT